MSDFRLMAEYIAEHIDDEPTERDKLIASLSPPCGSFKELVKLIKLENEITRYRGLERYVMDAIKFKDDHDALKGIICFFEEWRDEKSNEDKL